VGKHYRQRASELRALERMVGQADLSDHADAVSAAADAQMQLRTMAKVLEELPAAEREALLLYAWEDLTYSEIAGALGIPIGTVRSRPNRVRGRRQRAVTARAYRVTVGIVDDLLEHPGLYLGIVHDLGDGGEAAARILVTPLPGSAGVALDYETFNYANRDRIRGHHEHAVLARAHAGPTMLVTAHMHAASAAVLRESEPGVFELGPEGSPFPMKITIDMPAPGQLIHCWWYGPPGGEVRQHDRTELRLQQ
jgi:hypothetical protein